MNVKMTIEKDAYDKFMTDFTLGKYGSQRLGQAFYNRFELQKSTANKLMFDRFYNLEGELAKSFINSYFEFS